MSGGPAAIRGYLVQTLVALLETLDVDGDWISITLEPDHVSEKIDILWQYPGKIKAVQVKSSENQISVADAKRWAEEFLSARHDADKLVLVLVGPSSQAVLDLGQVEQVEVPPPQNLDLPGFIERAAHRLDRFLGSQSLPTGSADYREMLAAADGPRHHRPPVGAQGWRVAEDPAVRAPEGLSYKEFSMRRALRSCVVVVAAALCVAGQGAELNAAGDLDLTTGYATVAKLLRLPHDANDPANVLATVKYWLENVDGHSWLLVFDNLDDPPLLKPYLPGRASGGHILVTSRVRLDALGIRSALSIEKLPEEDATQFLLDRADRGAADDAEQQAARELARELDGLPLALEQAAAYAVAMHVTYGQYLDSYRSRKLGLLERQEPVSGDYPATVATTWLINFEQVQAISEAATDLLRLSAMLDLEGIPFELLTKGAEELGEPLREVMRPLDPFSVNEVLEPLARFSLVGIDAEGQTYSIHRLVQEVAKDVMGDERRRVWAERAVNAINAAFPRVEVSVWPACQRLVPHALAGSRLTKEFGFQSEAAGRLLSQTGYYMRARGQFGMAEPFCRQAIEIFREVLGEQHPDFATSLNNLAELYRSMGRYEQSEPLCRQALEIRRQVLGEQHPDFATSLNNL
ncbi:MAG: tetratricopeptide repeat protein, partial [Planctomycetia bacterium]|nr:tetratricopeptide repeat protein [Planctomycetia bacterium]